MTACGRCLQNLGGYVVGGLSAAETADVEHHLAVCSECRDEHARVADVPRLLDLLGSAPPRVPAHVRDHVMADAVRDRTRHRWLLACAAAALCAAVVAGTAVWQLTGGAGPPEVAVALEAVGPVDASGRVSFTEDEDGVGFRLEVEGLAPLEGPGVYEAWLSTDDRRVMSIGHLEVADGRSTLEVAVDGELGDFGSFWLTAEPDARDPAHDGPTVVRAPVPEIR